MLTLLAIRRNDRRRYQGTKSVFKEVIHAIEDKHDDDDDEILTISAIEVNAIEDTQHSIQDTRDEAFATLETTQPEKKRKINLRCKVDTGAQSNVLPVRLLRIIVPEKFDEESQVPLEERPPIKNKQEPNGDVPRML